MNFILPQGSRVHINIDRTAGIRIDSERGARECFAVLFPPKRSMLGREMPSGQRKKSRKGFIRGFPSSRNYCNYLVFKSMVLRYTHTILVSIIMTNIS